MIFSLCFALYTNTGHDPKIYIIHKNLYTCSKILKSKLNYKFYTQK